MSINYFPVQTETVKLTENITRWRICKYHASESVTLGDLVVETTEADTDYPAGVMTDTLTDGQWGVMVTEGKVPIEVQATSTPITVGDKIAPSTGGYGKKAASGDEVIGIAQQAAAADGTVILVQISRRLLA